jgi:hypothetical protein
MYGNPLRVQKIISGYDCITLKSQVHLNALCTFVSEREAQRERERIPFQLHTKNIFIFLGLTKVSIGLNSSVLKWNQFF